MEELPKTEQEIRQKIGDQVGQDVTPPGEQSPSILSEGADAVGSHVEELLGGLTGGSTVEVADNKKEGLMQRVLYRFKRKNPHQQVIEKKAA